MKGYEELVNENYKEPVNGLFDDVTASVLEALASLKVRSELHTALL